ncbi:MAG: DUF2723 domain-containing protein [Anaerolineae bacterium]|nr:DUF2723 domain-containing protein [Anaerolineae bacterium]
MTATASSDRPGRSNAQTGMGGAIILGLLTLALYTRTLAPDVLYSDSAEFQTLAYTLGTTHCTGYPVYLLLARLVGLLPFHTPAWRISLFSALGAAVAVAGTYLAIHRLTTSRIGAVLGSAALALSYTFWSQAVIAEVYTPAAACYIVCILLLWDWEAGGVQRRAALFLTTLLMGLGLGIHASVGLLIPVAAAFIVLNLWQRSGSSRDRRQTIGIAAGGGLLGVMIFILAFVLIDRHDPASSFINVAVIPSRSIWDLSAQELARPDVRLWVTVTGLQWRDAIFSGGIAAMIEALGRYGARLFTTEFSPLTLLCATVGFPLAVKAHKKRGWFLLGAFSVSLIIVANYHPGDWHVFYLPTHVLIAVGAGVGIAHGATWWRSRAWPQQPHLHLSIGVILLIGAIAGILGPFLPTRIDALRTGITSFSRETYVFPVEDPAEPRKVATAILESIPDGAVLVLDWRALYSVAYVAYVEGLRPHISLLEAAPHGSDGRVAASLLQTIDEALAAGRPVFVDTARDQYRLRYQLSPVSESTLHQLALEPTQ